MTNALPTSEDRLDVDFSLALHNRTGKYFIGRDLLALDNLPLGDVYYWHLARATPPNGLYARVIGRLQHWQVVGQTGPGKAGWLPRRSPRRPLLHLDPFTVPTTILRSCDAVQCHDLGPVSNPELFAPRIGHIYRHIYSLCETIGPHMIFISEATRDAFKSHYPAIDLARTHVVYPTIRTGIAAAEPIALPQVDGPFLLTVGSIGDRKNQRRCIAAFARSGLAARGFRYVICGGPEPGFERVEAAARSTDGVILLPYVSDAELSWLYGNACGFVLASLLEGFGMPVAEAIARGLVPLIGAEGVLFEVAGEAAVRVDPLDEASITAGMTALADMSGDEKRVRLVALARSIERFHPASVAMAWRATFDAILTTQRSSA